MTQTPAISTSPERTALPLAALIAAGILIGGSPIFVRLSEVGPIATAFWRLSISMVPLIAYAWIWRPQALKLPQTRADYLRLCLPGVFLAGDLCTWHLSVDWTSVANATLLVNLSPVFVTLGGWMLFDARVTRGFLAGLTIAVLGVALLKSGEGASFGNGHIGGDIFAVIGAMFYAGYILMLGRARGTFDTLTVMLWNTGTASICVLILTLLSERTFFPVTATGWEVLLGVALLSHVGGQSLIIYALAKLPAAFSSLTLLIQPVVASILGIVLLSEYPSIWVWIGGAIVLSGILVARLSP